MARSRIDWDKARATYVDDPTLTQDDIAKQFGMSFFSVKSRAARENWKELRKKVSLRTDEKLIDQASQVVVDVNDRHTQTYKNMQALALMELNIAIEELRTAQEDAMRNGNKVGYRDKAVIGQQRLKFLFDSLKLAMDGERITLGLATSVAVNKPESGKNGHGPDMFEEMDMDELSSTVIKAVTELAKESTGKHSA